MNAFVRGEQLQINIDFDTGLFTWACPDTAGAFISRLEELIAHCLSPEAGGHAFRFC
jgi:hypothetical protein